MRTSWLTNSAAALLVGMAAVHVAAQEDAAISQRSEKQPAKTEIKFDKILRAESLLNRNVLGLKGEEVGTVKDLAFDLETGHLALVVIKLENLPKQTPGYLAAPMLALQVNDKALQFRGNVLDARLADARRLPETAYHMQLNRGWAEEQYKIFKQKPYWVRIVGASGASLPPKPDQRDKNDRKYLLTLASRLKDVNVKDEAGDTIGHIRGFAISPNDGRVAYAAVDTGSGDNQLYPVPLGAFVVTHPEKNWVVQLSKKAIANTPSFKQTEWPNKVNDAWVEYVRVRYGGIAAGGVQHQQKPREKDKN